MKRLKILISNGVNHHSKIYDVMNEQEEENLMESLSSDLAKDGLYIDYVEYLKIDELEEVMLDKIRRIKRKQKRMLKKK